MRVTPVFESILQLVMIVLTPVTASVISISGKQCTVLAVNRDDERGSNSDSVRSQFHINSFKGRVSNPRVTARLDLSTPFEHSSLPESGPTLPDFLFSVAGSDGGSALQAPAHPPPRLDPSAKEKEIRDKFYIYGEAPTPPPPGQRVRQGARAQRGVSDDRGCRGASRTLGLAAAKRTANDSPSPCAPHSQTVVSHGSRSSCSGESGSNESGASNCAGDFPRP